MPIQTLSLPAGKVLTVTAGAEKAATLYRIDTAGSPGTPTAISVGATTSVGPFGSPYNYGIADETGSASFAITTPDPDTATAQAALDARVVLAEAAITANATPSTNAGTKAAVGTLAATETGDAFNKVTTLTLTDFAVGTAADDAALAIGALLYTLPAGTCSIDRAHVSVGLTLDSDTQTDTPELGIGTVVGSGANATLGDVGATSENVMTGEAVADVEGTSYVNGTPPSSPVLVTTGGAHTIYLNAADTWVDTTTGTRALTATGTIRIFWKFLGA